MKIMKNFGENICKKKYSKMKNMKELSKYLQEQGFIEEARRKYVKGCEDEEAWTKYLQERGFEDEEAWRKYLQEQRFKNVFKDCGCKCLCLCLMSISLLIIGGSMIPRIGRLHIFITQQLQNGLLFPQNMGAENAHR